MESERIQASVGTCIGSSVDGVVARTGGLALRHRPELVQEWRWNGTGGGADDVDAKTPDNSMSYRGQTGAGKGI